MHTDTDQLTGMDIIEVHGATLYDGLNAKLGMYPVSYVASFEPIRVLNCVIFRAEYNERWELLRDGYEDQ